MNVRTFAVALALVGAPLPVLAQSPAAPVPAQQRAHAMHAGQGQRGFRDPVARLLARRDQLGLTSDQASRLQAIGQRYEARNRPVLDRMRTLRPSTAQRQPGQPRTQPTDAQKQQRKAAREQARPLMQQLRESRKAERKEIEAVLTDAQKQQLKSWRKEQRAQGREGRRQGQQQGA
ncbi:MAG: Spy/CpxP family protein refolding chaperone [Gemmatimonadetes bacterium]|nr:Spy/CpxP family protein refolding chaperone [Gemmatimonadota bacterium]